MRHFTRKFLSFLLGIGLTLFAVVTPVFAATPSIDITGNRVSFNNTTKIGIEADPGFTHRYTNAVSINGQTADAILTVSSFTPNNVKPTISNVDRVSSTANYDLWTNLQIPSGGGQAVFNISFVRSGTNDPVTLQGVAINVGDIDARQYVQFSGVQSYTLSNPTSLTVQTTAQLGTIPAGSYRFWEQSGTGANDDDKRFWAQVNYGLPISSVDVVLGATVGGAALFEVSFSAANWGTTPITPTQVTPSAVNYTVSYDGNGFTGGAVPSTSTAAGGASHTIVGNTGSLTKGSAAFDSWNTRSDGTGVSYSAGETIIPTTDVVLYAIWLEPITISYDGNGNTGGSPPNAVTAIGAQTVASPGTLVKEGYTFLGWNTLADGTGVPYEPGEQFQPAANGALFAQWLEDPVVPTNSPIDIPINPGDSVGGSEVEFVVPELEPGSDYTLGLEGGGNSEELDSGVVDGTGIAEGTGTFPENVPEGDYELFFSGTTDDGSQLLIEKQFTVDSQGKLASKQDGVTRKVTVLARTGHSADGALIPFILLATGMMLILMTRQKRKSSHN